MLEKFNVLCDKYLCVSEKIIKGMKNNILHLSGGPEARKTFLHSDILDIDLETVGDSPWRSAWEKSFGEQQLFNQMVFFFQRIENKMVFCYQNCSDIL